MVEFEPWPKIPRINKPVVITEKIDGTNAAVGIREILPRDVDPKVERVVHDTETDKFYAVRAQSRKRFILPGKGTDNYEFAGWVFRNAEVLARGLGPGLHYGEWWGLGIQRTYGLDHRAFSLFNTARWAPKEGQGEPLPPELQEIGVDVVPVLAVVNGLRLSDALIEVLANLVNSGSVAAARRGSFNQRAEGVCVFHTASRSLYKYILDAPDTPKSLKKSAEFLHHDLVEVTA